MQAYGINRTTSRATLSDVSTSTSSTGSQRASPMPAPFSSNMRGAMHEYDDRSENNVYLRGLPEHTSEDMLTTWARSITEPVSVKVVRQRAPHERMGDSSALWDMGPCTGIGFVSFHTRGAAAAFIEMVNTADNKPGLAAVTACFAKETYTGKMEKAADRDSANLYLSHIPLSYTEQDVHALFPLSQYDVKSLRLLREGDRPGARGSPLTKFKGAAFCRLASREMAQNAINALDGKRLPGHEKRYSPTTGEPYYETLIVRFADSERQKFVKLVDREQRTAVRSIRSSSSSGSIHEMQDAAASLDLLAPATHNALSAMAALSTIHAPLPVPQVPPAPSPTPQQVAEATAVLQQYLASIANVAQPTISTAAMPLAASAKTTGAPGQLAGSSSSRWADHKPTQSASPHQSPVIGSQSYASSVSPPSKKSSGDDQALIGITRSLSIADPANNIWQFKPEELRRSLQQHALAQTAQIAVASGAEAAGLGQRRGTFPNVNAAEYPSAAFTIKQPISIERGAAAQFTEGTSTARSSMELPYVQPDFTFGTCKTLGSQNALGSSTDPNRTRTNTVSSSLAEYWATRNDSINGTPRTSRRNSNASDDIEERYLSNADSGDQAFLYAACNKHRASDAGTSTPGSTHSRSTGTPTTLLADPSSQPGRKASSPF